MLRLGKHGLTPSISTEHPQQLRDPPSALWNEYRGILRSPVPCYTFIITSKHSCVS